MEATIKLFIYIHAFLGAIGLFTGILSLILKKGSKTHKQTGKFFSVSMILSSLIILPICWLPNHNNLFLFIMGIFTIYLILSGNTIVKFKSKNIYKAHFTDYLISGIMLIFSILMLYVAIISYYKYQQINVLSIIFGVISVLLSINDFRFYKNLNQLKSKWIKHHIGKRTGGVIASFTAFLVAGLQLESLFFWIIPTFLGIIIIIYWQKKTNKFNPIIN